MSVQAEIVAIRGQTTYKFVVDSATAEHTLAEAVKCEQWINDQPDRLAAADRQSNMRSA